MNEYLPLAFFSIFIVGGLVIATPAGENLVKGKNATRRMLLGAILVAVGGLFTSMWTWIIHNQLAATGGSTFCAAEGVVQCGSVIGDPTYSTFLGFPWGIIGLGAFTALGYLFIALYQGADEKWAPGWMNMSYWLTAAGLPGVAWLVIVELFLVDGAPHICPYCTAVHVAILALFWITFTLRGVLEEGGWDKDAPKA